MQKAILGKKIGMTQIFTEDGLVIPVTVIEAGPVSVVQKKTVENDGYDAIQVGFADAKDKALNKKISLFFYNQTPIRIFQRKHTQTSNTLSYMDLTQLKIHINYHHRTEINKMVLSYIDNLQ